MLVSERPGRLRIVSPDGTLSDPLGGLPDLFTRGQGGLLDIELDPDFEKTGLVYFTFAEPGPGGAGTAVGRGRLAEDRLQDVEVIFRQEPKVSGGNHFGSRIAFTDDGLMFVTLGERFKFEPAQDLSNYLGKIVRIGKDGSVPADNPVVGRAGAKPEISTYGHRNVEGAAIDPATGLLWIVEMGPRGGDELNQPQKGRNYGWPVVSWGEHYDGRPIPDPPTHPQFADAVAHWTPVISPAGATFYRGDRFGGWNGSLLIAGLTARGLIRVTLRDRQVVAEERLDLGQRIRYVRPGPDGAVYLLTDEEDGEILRLTPEDDDA